MKIILPDYRAITVIAELVKEGLTFEARYDNDMVYITLTGGY